MNDDTMGMRAEKRLQHAAGGVGRALRAAMLGAAGWLVLAATPVQAQTEVRVTMDHDKFVLFEPMVAEVEITNNSGRPIRIGGEDRNAELRFEIKDNRGHLLDARAGAPEIREMLVEPWTRAAASVDLLRNFVITQAVPYSVKAVLTTEQGSHSSAPVSAEVVPGMSIMQLQGVVEETGENRIYELLTTNRNQREVLFLRIDNADRSSCYGVYDLGNVVRIRPPQMLFNERGQLCVLFQSGPARFTHHLFSARGMPIQKRYYTGRTGWTRMEKNPDGTVTLVNAEEYQGDPYTMPYETPRVRAFE